MRLNSLKGGYTMIDSDGKRSQTDGESRFTPEIDAFLKEVVELSKKHGLSLSHEDTEHAFVVVRYSEANSRWLLDASDGMDEKDGDYRLVDRTSRKAVGRNFKGRILDEAMIEFLDMINSASRARRRKVPPTSS
jgi:hypothetical protein